jgi:hypothetical protein
MERSKVCQDLCKELQDTDAGKKPLRKITYKMTRSGREYVTIVGTYGSIIQMSPKETGGVWDTDYDMIQDIIGIFFRCAEHFKPMDASN